MNSRSFLTTFLAFGAGVISTVVLLERARAPLPAASAAPGTAEAAPQIDSDEAALRAEVERLKEKATDQAHVMVSVAYHFNNLWFAAQHGNWPLAEFYLGETRSHLRWGVRVIPVRKSGAGQEIDLRPILESLENSALQKVADSIKAKDHGAFVDAYKFMLEGCHSCHGTAEKGYIRTKIPTQPAESMVDFDPPAEERQQPPEPGTPRGASEKEGKSTGEVEKPENKEKAMLVEPAELENRLKEAQLRVLDTRSRDDYAKAHVPGAVWVDVASWQQLAKAERGFQDAKGWAEKVGGLGIGSNSRVIVYGSNLTDTARVWWTLKYLGVESVALLDGGWDLWAKEKRPTETAVPDVVGAQFVPKFDVDRLAEIDFVKGSLKSAEVTVVDVRSEAEFTGKEVRGKRGGHIAGATNLEWKELLAGDGRFKKPQQLRDLFRERGILPETTAVCY